jgi:uncharacterized protein with HEPN domain
MSKPHNRSYLLDILDCAEQINLFMKGISLNEFDKDLM